LLYKQFSYDRIATYVKEIGLAKNEKPGVKFGDLPPAFVQVNQCTVARLLIYNLNDAKV